MEASAARIRPAETRTSRLKPWFHPPRSGFRVGLVRRPTRCLLAQHPL